MKRLNHSLGWFFFVENHDSLLHLHTPKITKNIQKHGSIPASSANASSCSIQKLYFQRDSITEGSSSVYRNMVALLVASEWHQSGAIFLCPPFPISYLLHPTPLHLGTLSCSGRLRRHSFRLFLSWSFALPFFSFLRCQDVLS